jgi:hypothetical protein
MYARRWIPLAALLCGTAARAQTADQIVQKVLEADPWGMSGAEVTARAIIKDANGSVRQLEFNGRSRRHDPPLSKSIVRFRAPADLTGVGFLQVQRRDGDDERFLYMPELKRSRRIGGNTRSNSFMGTDFSYADVDRRDVRNSKATSKGDENVGRFACFHLELIPNGADAQYARLEMWVRKDNFVPLKLLMYNKAGVLLKTLLTQEVRRVQGRWFITRSLMQNHADSRTTELLIEDVKPRDDIPDGEFTVLNLERS